jgi:hypothetical protein
LLFVEEREALENLFALRLAELEHRLQFHHFNIGRELGLGPPFLALRGFVCGSLLWG